MISWSATNPTNLGQLKKKGESTTVILPQIWRNWGNHFYRVGAHSNKLSLLLSVIPSQRNSRQEENILFIDFFLLFCEFLVENIVSFKVGLHIFLFVKLFVTEYNTQTYSNKEKVCRSISRYAVTHHFRFRYDCE